MASSKRAPGSRPAVDRGIPVRVVDALIEVLGVDEHEITVDAMLADDFGADDYDLVEIGDLLGCEDECLEWALVSDIIAVA